MLGWILSQNSRNTLPLHTADQLVSNAKNKGLLWLAGMRCVRNSNNSNILQDLKLILLGSETRIFVLQTELKMDASQTVNRMLGPIW